MGNSILTSQVITREALRILHEKLQFIGRVNRQYDDKFAVSGAKIGDTLNVRLPNQYVVRRGRKAVPQDTSERTTPLVVANQIGVDTEFYSDELTMSLDDFSKRVLEPAMSTLATNIENDTIANVLPGVYNAVGTPAVTPSTLLQLGQIRQKLKNYLAPEGDGRTLLINTDANASLVDAFKTLFQDGKAVSKQYLEGFVTRAQSFDLYESNLIPTITAGSRVANAGRTDGAGQVGAALKLKSFAAGATIGAGEKFTISGVYAVHPETKVAYNFLQKFTTTAAGVNDGSGNFAALAISPAIITSGAYQNVSAAPGDGATITFDQAASASAVTNIGFHRDAFAFVTADLVMPKGMDMASRIVQDGISLRFVRGYDINEDQFISRFDVLHGSALLRPEFACVLYG